MMRGGVRVVRAILGGVLLFATLLGALPAPSAAAGQRWCPPETGFCTENAFYDFWLAHGDLEILGYPIDSPRRAQNGTIFQFFERATMEWHPENPVAYQVLLTRIAASRVEYNPARTAPPVSCSADCNLFAETNHTLRDTFRDYWLANGGLAVFGFPLTEQTQERNLADGKVYTVQYFERNRFEYHPENQMLLANLR